MRPMGIRYLAISIDTDDYLRISAGRCPTCGARPHTRERNYAEPQPDVLDLDKSWGYLRHFFESIRLDSAAELVAGHVTHTSGGWISHQGTIAPGRVTAVTAELMSVSADQLRDHFRDGGGWRDKRSRDDFEYVSSYLAAAVTFTAKVAKENRGIVYYIG